MANNRRNTQIVRGGRERYIAVECVMGVKKTLRGFLRVNRSLILIRLGR